MASGDHRHDGWVDDSAVGHVVRTGWGRMDDGLEGVVLEVHWPGSEVSVVILGPEDVDAILTEVVRSAPSGVLDA